MEMRQASTVPSGLTGATRKERGDQAVQRRWPFPGTVKGSGLSAGVAAVPAGSRVTGQKIFGGRRCHLQVCSLWSQSGKHQGGYYVDLSPEASWILQAQGVASSQLLCPGFLSPPEVFGLLAV